MRLLMRCAASWLVVGIACSAVAADESGVPAAPKFPFDAKAAAEYQAAYAKAAKLPAKIELADGITLVLVPPGKFLMGSPPNEKGRGGEPLHEVTLTRAFCLGQHEITRGQFAAFVKATGHRTDAEKSGGGHAHDAKANWEHRPGTSWLKPGYAGEYTPRDDHPIVHVSHTDAVAFCKWLSDSKENKNASKLIGDVPKFRLPTESEWEWACRAGSATRFWWGDEEDTSGKVANVGDQQLKKVQPDWPRPVMAMNDGHAFVAPVGSYRANAFGLHDMLGNVWEFCGSRHGGYPKEPSTDPGDLSKAESFSVRGGGWSNVAADCRCATRNSDPPHFGHSNLGFRIAIDAGGGVTK